MTVAESARNGACQPWGMLGAGTAAAATAVAAVRAKVEDFFARCRLAAFDPRALAALNRSEADYLAALIARDAALAPEFAAIAGVERLER